MIIDHYGVTVTHLSVAVKKHTEFYGYHKLTSVMKIENQGVYAQILSNDSGINLELLSPIDDSSPIVPFLRRGIGIAHICYKTKQFDKLYNRYKSKVVRPPSPAPLEYFNGGRTFFIHNGIYLVEFLEHLV